MGTLKHSNHYGGEGDEELEMVFFSMLCTMTVMSAILIMLPYLKKKKNYINIFLSFFDHVPLN